MIVTVFEKSVKREVEIPATLKMLDDSEEIPAGHSVFSILNQDDGDKRIVWDSRNLAEIRDAKDLFDRLIAEGMRPYVVTHDGKKTHEIMTIFDPIAEEVLMGDHPKSEVVFTPQKALVGG
jgi:hypothetical protein